MYGSGWLAGAAVSSFVNPYYSAPIGDSTVVYNYSEPVPVYVPSEPVVVQTPPQTVYVETAPALPVPTEPVPPAATTAEKPPEPPPEDPKVKEAGTYFNAARNSFKAGNYAEALNSADKAVQLFPNDASLHEFRALCLFAMKKYPEATGVIYSVLAVGPGWDWQTMKELYPNQETYQQQLRDLQQYVASNPKDAASRFLLAYHCLVLEQKAEAVTLLKRVVELNPKDQLASEMVKALDTTTSASPMDRPKVTTP
jgi:predicted Zn-dependent protease